MVKPTPGLSAWAGAHNPFGGRIVGCDLFSASLILAIMVIPTIAAISPGFHGCCAHPSARGGALPRRDPMGSSPLRGPAPTPVRGSSAARSWVLGRALGETMAVTLVIGNSISFPNSLFRPGQTIASLIANQFAETSRAPRVSALIEAGLVLLLITLAVNIGARAILWRYQRNVGRE